MDAALSTPFFFRQRYGQVNWTKLSLIDVDSIIGNCDLDSLQSLLDELTFSKLNSKDQIPQINGESLAIKGWQIQQLIVEYLLNVQESINSNENALKGELRSAAHHVADLDVQLRRLKDHNKSLKRELKMYQAVVKTCENMLTYYGLDSSEIFLAARAASAHYGKSPPAPFQADEKPAGLLGAVECLNKEAMTALSEANENDAAAIIKNELREIAERVALLKNSLATGKPLPAKEEVKVVVKEVIKEVEAPQKSIPLSEPQPEPIVEPEVEIEDESPYPVDRGYTQPRPHQPLQRGRLTVSCVSADNIMNKDSKLQPYIKLKLGNDAISNPKAKAKKTKTAKKADAGGKCDFRNEKVHFNIQDPSTLTDKDGCAMLKLELYDDNFFSDKCVCVAEVDVTDSLSRPFHYNDGPLVKTIDLHKPGTSEDCGQLTIKLEFWAARTGVFRLQLKSAKNLYDVGNFADTQDPYVYVSVGKQKVRSKTVNNGATNPTFSNEELLLYVSEHDWHKDCLLELWDDDVGADDLICSQKINLLHMMSVGGYKHTGDSIALFRDGKPAGHLFAECEWLPVGKLTCIVHSAKALRNPDSWGKPDPYVTVELNQLEPMELKNLDDATKRLGKKSQEVKKILKSVAQSSADAQKMCSQTKMTQVINGTLDPVWKAELSFDVIDGDTITLTCYDEDIGYDDLIGKATVSLSDVLQTGISESWIPLTFSSKKGECPAGDLKLQLAFWGPPGVSYPQRPAVAQTCYDESERICKTMIPPSTSPFMDTEETDKLLTAPGILDSSGMLSVSVIEGNNLKGNDSKLFAYVRCKVGPVKKAMGYKSKNVRVGGTGTADWSNERIDIPINEPFKLEEGGDINLTVDLMDDNTFSDSVLGTAVIKLKDSYLSQPGEAVEATYEMTNGKGSGTLKLSVCFKKSCKGALLLTLCDAKNLGNRAGMFSSASKMDPYVYCEVGKLKARSNTVNNGGKTPNFNNEELLVYCDSESWKEDAQISVYDDNVGSDAKIGTTTLSLLPLMNPTATPDNVDVETAPVSHGLTHKGKMAGELRFGTRFLPAGKLTVKCVAGRNLRNPDRTGKSDPFLQLNMDSQIKPHGVQEAKTNTHSDGGSDPIWNFDCEFDIIDQYEISVAALDKDFLGSDNIGNATLSLLELFKDAASSENSAATQDLWLPLTYDAGKKGKLPAGDCHLILYFVGARGATYPLYRPTITGDSASLTGIDSNATVESAGDVLNVTPVTSMEELKAIKPTLTERVSRGQISVTVHEGININNSDSKLNAYVVGKLCGAKKGALKKTTKTTQKATNGNDPDFSDEKLRFDIIDIEKLKAAAVKENGNDTSTAVMLTFELWDDNYLSDKSLGVCQVDISELLKRPTVPLKMKFSLDKGGELNLTICFMASFSGIVKVTLIEARNLPDKGGMMDTQDPYVKVSLPHGRKDQEKCSKVINDGGVNPSFGREQLLLWCADEPGEKGLKSWVKPMEIEMFDSDTMMDDLIGKCEIDLLEYAAIAMGAESSAGGVEGVEEAGGNDSDSSDSADRNAKNKVVMRSYPLAMNGKPGGKLIAIVEFIPAANLEIICKAGKNLKNPNLFGTADPYLQLECKSLTTPFGDFDRRSETHNGGGNNPQWKNEVIKIQVCDHSELVITCWDDDVGADDMIGKGKVSLLDVYEAGFVDRWIGLSTKKGKAAGEIHLSFRVTPPQGLNAIGVVEEGKSERPDLKYPMCQPTLKSYVIPVPKAATSGEGGGDGSDTEPAEKQASERGPRGPSGIGSLMPTRSWKQRKGTISVRVHEIDDVQNSKKKLIASVSLRVGGDSEIVPQKTKSKTATEGGYIFDPAELFEFDCSNIESLVSEDDLELCVEILDKTTLVGVSMKKTVVAEKRISIKQCLETPGVILEGDDIVEGGGSWFNLNKAGDDDANGKVRLSIAFYEARVGLLAIDMIKVTDLPDRGGFFDKNMDPYTVLKLGGSKSRTKVYKDKGSAFKYDLTDETRKLTLWCNDDNYFEDCVLQVWDSNTGMDTLLGEKKIDLMDIMSNRGQQDSEVITYDLSTGEGQKNKKKGSISCTSAFHAVGSLVVEVIEGKDLRKTDLVGENDAYCKVQMVGGKGGKKSDSKQRTQTVNGSNHPVWDAELTFEPCDHTELLFKVFDDDTFTRDDVIGECKFSLTEVYKTGVSETWLDLTYGKKNKPAGSIHVIFTFFGSETLHGRIKSGKETLYPCLSTGDRFGDKDRINVIEKLDGSIVASPKPKKVDRKQVEMGGGSLTGDKLTSKSGNSMEMPTRQAFGSSAPGSGGARSGSGMTASETIVLNKMRRVDDKVKEMGDEILTHKKMSDDLVFDSRAEHLHDKETLKIAHEIGEKEVKAKMARFGVGEGLGDEKLSKKMEMLERNRIDDLDEEARKRSKKLEAVVEKSVEAGLAEEAGGKNIGNVSPRTGDKVKSKVYENIERGLGGGEAKLSRTDSIHLEGAREGIKYAVTELPKQSDYDHDDYNKGDDFGEEGEEGKEKVKSPIENSVSNLPDFDVEEDFDDEDEDDSIEELP